MSRQIGMWMYENGGGTIIENKIISLLKEREIETVRGLNLRFADGGYQGLKCSNILLDELDLFFSYNAGEQTLYQRYLYEEVNRLMPTINSFEAFALTEDKFKSNMALNNAGIKTPQFYLCHRDEKDNLRYVMKKWGNKLVYKPVDGWGGVGVTLLESPEALDMIMPFLNSTDQRMLYVEEYIPNDHTDFRVDIVDGEYVACYGRKAAERGWKTNITSGGSVILREPNDEIINIAKAAAKATKCDIAGVDILYNQEKEEYVGLEVNGIPAFATPDQEKMGLNFNDKKIELIVNMIDKKAKGQA